MCDVYHTAVYPTRDTNMYSILLRGRGILLIFICSQYLTHSAPILCIKVSNALYHSICSHLQIEVELSCFALYSFTRLVGRYFGLGINAMIKAEPS